MEGYSQTPPEGLWEELEPALPAPPPAVPGWVWAFAGVAAAMFAVMLIVVRPGSHTAPDAPLAEAGTVAVDTVGQTGALVAEVTDRQEPVGVAAPVPVIPAAAPRTTAKHVTDQPDLHPVAEPVAETVASEPGSIRDTSPVREEPVVIKELVVPEGQEVSAARKPAAPVETKPASVKQEIRRKPVVGASFIAGGVPGSYADSFTEYAMSGVRAASSLATPSTLVSLLSRNRETNTDVDYSVTMRVGALVNISFTERWGLETGLQLSNLKNVYKSDTGNLTSVTDKTVSYLGIPLYAVYTPVRVGKFSLYASAGPMFEYGFFCKGSTGTYIDGKWHGGRDNFKYYCSDPIWSLNANLGAQYKVSSVGTLFIQPGLSWHLRGEGNNESLYTAQPLLFSLGGGFRFLF